MALRATAASLVPQLDRCVFQRFLREVGSSLNGHSMVKGCGVGHVTLNRVDHDGGELIPADPWRYLVAIVR